MKLTIYHNGQFWVGIAEQLVDGKVSAVQHVFGAEPQDAEILTFVNQHLFNLFRHSSGMVPIAKLSSRKINPKRLARTVARQLKSVGISTYAQQAINLEQEQRKKTKQETSKKQKELEKERQWQLKRAKAKAKKRGH